MPVFIDAIDSWNAQVEVLRATVREAKNVRYIKASADSVLESGLPGAILLAGPQDSWVHRVRGGEKPLIGLLMQVPILMLDMKGPSGIDTTLMLLSQGLDVRYVSPLVGDVRHATAFSHLAELGVAVWPLPYFPARRVGRRVGDVDEKVDVRPPHLPGGGQRVPRIAFAGSVYPSRTMIVAGLTEALGEDVVQLRSGLPYDEYLRFLASSSIGLDIRGVDLATYRLHELLICGTCPLIDYRPLALFDQFPGFVAKNLYFRNLDEAIERAAHLLANVDQAESMGEKARSWYRTSHAPEAYAQYLAGIATSTPSRAQMDHHIYATEPFAIEQPGRRAGG